jgi:hypothetical protein
MARAFTLLAAVGLLTLGVGCKHIGGLCDCATHPDNGVLPAAGNPYAVVGSPPAPAAMPAAEKKMEKMEVPVNPGK